MNADGILCIVNSSFSLPKDVDEERFIPATRAVPIGRDVVYRPIRSWHSGTFAGEGLRTVGDDASGCVIGEMRGFDVAMLPKSVTHRIYWNIDKPEQSVSAFLSYPNGLGSRNTYFWEMMLPEGEDVERFDSEEEMELVIRNTIGSLPRCEIHADCIASRRLAEACAVRGAL